MWQTCCLGSHLMGINTVEMGLELFVAKTYRKVSSGGMQIRDGMSLLKKNPSTRCGYMMWSLAWMGMLVRIEVGY